MKIITNDYLRELQNNANAPKKTYAHNEFERILFAVGKSIDDRLLGVKVKWSGAEYIPYRYRWENAGHKEVLLDYSTGYIVHIQTSCNGFVRTFEDVIDFIKENLSNTQERRK